MHSRCLQIKRQDGTCGREEFKYDTIPKKLLNIHEYSQGCASDTSFNLLYLFFQQILYVHFDMYLWLSFGVIIFFFSRQFHKLDSMQGTKISVSDVGSKGFK